ncbi:MAG: hypothetical protein ACK55I_43960, partial [bacterium]
MRSYCDDSSTAHVAQPADLALPYDYKLPSPDGGASAASARPPGLWSSAFQGKTGDGDRSKAELPAHGVQTVMVTCGSLGEDSGGAVHVCMLTPPPPPPSASVTLSVLTMSDPAIVLPASSEGGGTSADLLSAFGPDPAVAQPGRDAYRSQGTPAAHPPITLLTVPPGTEHAPTDDPPWSPPLGWAQGTLQNMEQCMEMDLSKISLVLPAHQLSAL